MAYTFSMANDLVQYTSPAWRTYRTIAEAKKAAMRAAKNDPSIRYIAIRYEYYGCPDVTVYRREREKNVWGPWVSNHQQPS